MTELSNDFILDNDIKVDKDIFIPLVYFPSLVLFYKPVLLKPICWRGRNQKEDKYYKYS